MQYKKMIAILFSLLILLSAIFTQATQRPKLRPKSRNYFAGRFLLVPRDDRPSSYQQPRMIAAIADHDLIIPPARLLGNADQIIDWAKSVDFDGVNGAIVYLGAVPKQTENQPGQGQRQRQRKQQPRDQLELIKIIRSQRPGIPIYGYINSKESSSQIDGLLNELGDEKLINLLTISSPDQSANEWQKSIEEKAASRRLVNKVVFSGEPDSVAISLLVRMLNQRFGFAPRILPAYSSSAGRDATLSGQSVPLHQLVKDLIKKTGGIEVRQNSDAARSVDIILFIHTDQSRDSERNDLVEAIAQTSEKNVRLALVDLTGMRESGDALISNLRRRKLLDRLGTFAALDPAHDSPVEVITRAIAQASSYQAGIRFLRDDLDRVRRIDRAQAALLLSRYLSDWAFPFYVRPKLQSSDTEVIKSGNLEAVETFALNQLKPLADEIFLDQFKRNAHSYLLSYGERADFEVHLLQRLMVRLYPSKSQSFEVEIKPSIYNFHHGNEIVPQMRTQKTWELFNDDLDERVAKRWNAVDWPIFKTDAQSVEMTVKVSSPASAHPETLQSYAIVSKRSGETRRVEITATTPRGAFYAIGRLERMGADGQLNRDFQINEKPAVTQRGLVDRSTYWSHRERIEMLRFLGRNRMNRYYYFRTFDVGVGDGEAENSDDDDVRELVRAADENFVQMVFGFILPDSAFDDRNLRSLVRELDRLAALGVRSFVIGFANDREKQTGGSLEPSSFISRIRENLNRSNNVELSFWPNSEAGAPNKNRPRMVFNPAEQLCHAPWSGPVPGGNQSAYLVAAADQLQLTKLMAAKASEQAWNGSGYDPGRAWNSTLNLLFDEKSRTGLRTWVQHFEDCRKTENISEINRELIERRTAELQVALESISGTRDHGLLRGDLAQFLTRVQEALQGGNSTKKEE
jgi:Protein of unknown function (DUF4127)/beta-N-acetylglucosaminidase